MSNENAFTREEVMIWLQASCSAQGVPLNVVDRAALRQVSVLLGMDSGEREGAVEAGTSSARAEGARRTARQSSDGRAS